MYSTHSPQVGQIEMCFLFQLWYTTALIHVPKKGWCYKRYKSRAKTRKKGHCSGHIIIIIILHQPGCKPEIAWQKFPYYAHYPCVQRLCRFWRKIYLLEGYPLDHVRSCHSPTDSKKSSNINGQIATTSRLFLKQKRPGDSLWPFEKSVTRTQRLRPLTRG